MFIYYKENGLIITMQEKKAVSFTNNVKELEVDEIPEIDKKTQQLKVVDGKLTVVEKNIKNNNIIEINRLKQRLKELDYIGIKIATGRATIEEYAEEIKEMKQLADRINELKSLK